MDLQELRLYDRSRVVTDWKCPRARFLGYELDGKGIVSSTQGLELFLGTVIHDSLSGIARGIDIEKICEAATAQLQSTLEASQAGLIANNDFIHEQQCLIEGLIRGFYKAVWPRLISQYPNIMFIEEEMLYPHNGLGFMAKPDLVLGNDEGEVVYFEYKSTSTKKEDWINSWDTAVQIHSTCKAVEVSKGMKVTSTIVQGLYKGYVAYGKQTSPFCYGYGKKGSPPFSQDIIQYEYRAGLKKQPVWEMEGGIKGWVDAMPEVMLNEQFPQTPPIFIKEDLVNNFFKQREYREKEIEMAIQLMKHADEDGKREILNVAFPQKFDQCYPSFGSKCGFRKICHGSGSDPLSQGYVYRTPHHEPEADQWKRKEEVNKVVDEPYWDDSMGVVIAPEVV